MTSRAVKSFLPFFHIIYTHFAQVELPGISPKLISMVASAHIHTQRPLKDLWKKSILDNWPKGVFSSFSKGGNIKNQVSNYLLRILLLSLGSGQCRTVLILGCLAEGGMTDPVLCPLRSSHLFSAAGWAERWGYIWGLGMSLCWYGGDSVLACQGHRFSLWKPWPRTR